MKSRAIILSCIAVCSLALVSFSGMRSDRSVKPGQDSTRGQIVFCDEIDDNWNPVNPVTKISKGNGVNFLVKLKEGLAVTGVVWDVYKVGPDGKDAEPFHDALMMSSDPDQKFKYWGTTEKTFFADPGTYRVYMYPKNTNPDNYKSGNWENYSAVGVIVVE